MQWGMRGSGGALKDGELDWNEVMEEVFVWAAAWGSQQKGVAMLRALDRDRRGRQREVRNRCSQSPN